MSSRLALLSCRLCAPEKLPDRLLLSGFLAPANPVFLHGHIALAYLFEVSKPWLPSSQLLPTLVHTLEDQFDQLKHGSPLDDQFELVLRAVNQQLNAVSEKGETDWIGNLNGLIMLIGKDEVHFSQTGHFPAYLLQNNRIRQITDDIVQEGEVHPLKTFSNLASGKIQSGDHLLIANQELYNEISLDALRRIMNTTSPFQTCQAITRELKKDRNNKVAALILEIGEEGKIQSEEPTDVLLEEEFRSSLQKVVKRLIPVLHTGAQGAAALASVSASTAKKVGQASLTAASQAKQVTKERVIPATNTLIEKSSEQLRKTQQARSKRPVVEVILPRSKQEESASPSTPEPTQETPPGIDEKVDPTIGSVIPASELRVEGLHSHKPSPTHPFIRKAQKFLTRKLPYYLANGFRQSILWLQVPRNKKLAALGLASILIGTTVWGALARNTSTTPEQSTEEVATTLNELERLVPTIRTAIDLEQQIEASRSIQEAYRKLTFLTNVSGEQKSAADKLWNEVTTQADRLTSTKRLTTVVAQYPQQEGTTGFITRLPYFYSWKEGGNTIQRTGKGSLEEVNLTLTLPDPNDVIISMTESSEADTVGYVLTRQSKVYRIIQIGSNTTLKAINPQEGKFATGSMIASYSGNVYILEGQSGLLWRYLNTGTNYARGTSIIDINRYDISGSTALAIDGSIYLLKQNGVVQKFTSGKEDTGFSLKNTPELSKTLTKPAQIETRESSSSLYLLDAGMSSGERSTAKIIEYTKNGEFVGQYGFSTSFTNVRSFSINPQSRKLWLLNGSLISEFDI